MLKKNYFSIIIPVFNGSDFIDKCLKSVLNQSYKKYEVIIINDCSKDDTKKLLEAYKKNKKIIVINNKENIGADSSRNEGLKIAKGHYIAFLDIDDCWHPDFLKIYKKYFDQGYEFLYSSYIRVKDNIQINRVFVPDKINYNMMKYANFIPLSTACFDRTKVGEHFFQSNLKICEDYVFWITMLQKNHLKNKGIQKPLMYYRVHQNNMSSNKLKTLYEVLLIHKQYFNHDLFKIFFYLSCWVLINIKKRFV